MPNWCSNTLNVTGDRRAVRALMAQVADAHPEHERPTAFSLARIAPVPEELDLVLDTGSLVLPGPSSDDVPADLDARGWRMAHWGTKWDVTATLNVGHDSDGALTATYSFDSAWGPPQAAVGTLARQYATCAFSLSYDEPGNNFAGEIEWANGAIVSQTQGDSESWDDDWDDDDQNDNDQDDPTNTDEEGQA